jgi:hypothetical protein
LESTQRQLGSSRTRGARPGASKGGFHPGSQPPPAPPSTAHRSQLLTWPCACVCLPPSCLQWRKKCAGSSKRGALLLPHWRVQSAAWGSRVLRRCLPPASCRRPRWPPSCVAPITSPLPQAQAQEAEGQVEGPPSPRRPVPAGTADRQRERGCVWGGSHPPARRAAPPPTEKSFRRARPIQWRRLIIAPIVACRSIPVVLVLKPADARLAGPAPAASERAGRQRQRQPAHLRLRTLAANRCAPSTVPSPHHMLQRSRLKRHGTGNAPVAAGREEGQGVKQVGS